MLALPPAVALPLPFPKECAVVLGVALASTELPRETKSWADTHAACAARCVDDTRCGAFAYLKKRNVCTLHTRVSAPTGLRKYSRHMLGGYCRNKGEDAGALRAEHSWPSPRCVPTACFFGLLLCGCSYRVGRERAERQAVGCCLNVCLHCVQT